MERFCIITNREKDEGLAVTKRLVEILNENKKSWYLTEEHITENGCHSTRAEKIPEDVECAIVLGGDGTILQASHDLAERQIPILGINMGTLGFLAEIELSEVREALDQLFAGQYIIEEHMMLSVSFHLHNSADGGRGAEPPSGNTPELPNEDTPELPNGAVPDGLNDLVITRSGFSRLIGAEIYVNGELVNVYQGDGVIISTPTGSTGYNLSAGGPILSPAAEMIVITPICPHSLNSRSIVVSAEDKVAVRIRTSKKTQQDEAIATIDGSYAVNLGVGDYIEIKKAKRITKLVRFHSGSFYQVLRMKLNGD